MKANYQESYNIETTTLAFCLGITPSPQEVKKKDWTFKIAESLIDTLNLTTSKINFSPDKNLSLSFAKLLTNSKENNEADNKQHIINGIYIHIFIQTILTTRNFLSDNIALNISQITKFTEDMGYFELCTRNILCGEEKFVPVAGDKESYEKEKTPKSYDMLKISDDYKKYIENNDLAAMRSRDAKLRINMKSICLENDKETPCQTYINHTMNWINQKSNDLSISNTDMIYTIISYFRKFDSSLKSFFTYMNQSEQTTKERRRLTRNVYKNHVSLFEIVFKEISTKDSEDRTLDKYLHNYEFERLFHFQFLQQLLEARNIINSYYNNLHPSVWKKIDNLLINCAFLPNAFNRKYILAQILGDYFGITLQFDHYGIIQKCTNFKSTPLTKTLDIALEYLNFFSHIYYPALCKTFLYSLMDTNRCDYENAEPSSDITNLCLEQTLKQCRADFITKYLNPDIENKDVTADYNNYLINPVMGYIAPNDSKTVINKYCYTRQNPSDLSGDEIDFLTNFYYYTLAPNVYCSNNNVLMDYRYFGLNYTPRTKQLDFVKQFCENSLKFSPDMYH